MKKLLLSLFAVTSLSAGAQVTVFEDSFETYEDFAITGFGEWLTIDTDGLNTYTGGLPDGVDPWPNSGAPQAWMIFNPSVAQVTNDAGPCDASGNEQRNFDPHTGLKYAGSWAGVPDAVAANNDVLVSPPINLGASNNVVKFWVKQLAHPSCYGTEIFRVGIINAATTPTVFTDFTTISGFSNVAASEVWVEKTYTVPAAWANTQVRFGIQNRSADAYMLMVDDFVVTSSNLATNDLLANRFSVFPNPSSNVINVTSSDAIGVNQIQITDLNGRVVKDVTFDGVSELQVNISDLTSGMYMMNIMSEEGTAVKKIVRK